MLHPHSTEIPKFGTNQNINATYIAAFIPEPSGNFRFEAGMVVVVRANCVVDKARRFIQVSVEECSKYCNYHGVWTRVVG